MPTFGRDPEVALTIRPPNLTHGGENVPVQAIRALGGGRRSMSRWLSSFARQ